MSMSPGSHCPTCGQPKFRVEATPVESPVDRMLGVAPGAYAAAAAAEVPWWHRLLNALEPFEPLLLDALQRWLGSLGK